MGDDKVQELLLQLVQDMSFVKTKLASIDEQKISSRIDALEAQNREQDRVIKSLGRRNDMMEEFTRNNINDAKKQQTTIFVSMGIAVFSALVSFIFNLI